MGNSQSHPSCHAAELSLVDFYEMRLRRGFSLFLSSLVVFLSLAPRLRTDEIDETTTYDDIGPNTLRKQCDLLARIVIPRFAVRRHPLHRRLFDHKQKNKTFIYPNSRNEPMSHKQSYNIKQHREHCHFASPTENRSRHPEPSATATPNSAKISQRGGMCRSGRPENTPTNRR